MAQLLLQANATVTICHRYTHQLQQFTQRADVLISAVGKPHLIGANDVKEGAVVLDVGISRQSNGKLLGDVDTNNVLPCVRLITPVPGGVGPMTVTMLLENTYKAYCRRLKNA